MTAPLLNVLSTDDPTARQVLSDGLRQFSMEVTGYQNHQPLSVLAIGAAGVVLGGAMGRTSYGLAFLDLFYLPPELRGAGLGARILAMFEAEAVLRGCRSGVVYTISFQAPGFYEKQGWQRFGEIPCDPPGSSRVFLSKRFPP